MVTKKNKSIAALTYEERLVKKSQKKVKVSGKIKETTVRIRSIYALNQGKIVKLSDL